MIPARELFKKRCAQEVNNNILSSSRAQSTQSICADEKYLVLDKEFKKLTKVYKELNEKYEKMKNLSIEEKYAFLIKLEFTLRCDCMNMI